MLNTALPTFRELICPPIGTDPFWGADNQAFLSKSTDSLRLIFQSIRKCSCNMHIEVLVPAFFCDNTLEEAKENGVEYYYYQLDDSLNPIWENVRTLCSTRHIDVFLMCHYYGSYHDMSFARNFCNQKQILFIEDCAHVLYPGNIFGKKGDFVLYSPHKCLPMPDGAILCVNLSKSESIRSIQYDVMKSVPEELKDNCITWRLKKGLQCFLRKQRKIKWDFEPHFSSGAVSRAKPNVMGISYYSRRLLERYDEKRLRIATTIRRDNMEILSQIIRSIDESVRPLPFVGEGAPYVGVFNFEASIYPEKVIKKLNQVGIHGMYWPDLPRTKKEGEDSCKVARLSENYICFPVHQGILQGKYAKILVKANVNKKTKGENIRIQRVSKSREDRLWKDICEEIELRVIPQEWQYGEVKGAVEGWRPDRFLIFKGEKPIGVLQCLVKLLVGIPVAVRVNRGPLFICGEDSTKNTFDTLDLIRDVYPHPMPIFYASNLRFSPDTLADAISRGWYAWRTIGFSSGVIDLRKEKESLRKNLDGKWRNQLRSAEKRGMTLISDRERLADAIDIYEVDQKKKGYKGISSYILYALWEADESPLRMYRVENDDGDIIAFDIFYVCDNYVLYLVGWNGSEGRKAYVNNLILFTALMDAKEKMVPWFELGGIDFINTPENARFKMGMNPVIYRTLGEFVRV